MQTLSNLFISAALVLTASLTVALQAAAEPILLWPDDPALNAPTGMGEPKTQGDKTRVQNISTPHILPYLLPDSSAPAPVILLVPGGGYSKLVPSVHEPIAAFLNERGIHAIIVMYRCPTDRNKGEALPDLQRAIRLVRSRAAEWNIDPQRVGVLGSSAGGNLCVRTTSANGEAAYPAVDAIDEASAKPDFSVLLYPAWLGHRSELTPGDFVNMPEDMGPTVIFSARDDKHFYSSEIYGKALREAGRAVSEHYFDTGDHGFSIPAPGAAAVWPELFHDWLVEQALVRQ